MEQVQVEPYKDSVRMRNCCVQTAAFKTLYRFGSAPLGLPNLVTATKKDPSQQAPGGVWRTGKQSLNNLHESAHF